MKRAILLLAVLAATPRAALADFVGRVVKVSDGDTLAVLVETKQVRVRLAAKTARVIDKGMDRYGCTVAWIVCDGVDANSEQVRRGMAWVFVRYAPRNSPLYGLQGEAQGTRRGLWADPHPTAPWDWRLKTRQG